MTKSSPSYRLSKTLPLNMCLLRKPPTILFLSSLPLQFAVTSGLFSGTVRMPLETWTLPASLNETLIRLSSWNWRGWGGVVWVGCVCVTGPWPNLWQTETLPPQWPFAPGESGTCIEFFLESIRWSSVVGTVDPLLMNPGLLSRPTVGRRERCLC